MNALTPPLGRVLVVDDEVELMAALKEALTEQGYEMVGVTSAHAALEALRTREFDLLLTDLMMPGMDGIALLTAGLAIDPHLVGIVMTGQGAVPTAVEAMKIGAFDYLLKPFQLDNLLPLLARAMDVRRLRLENIQLRATVAIYNLSQVVAFSLDSGLILEKTVDAVAQQVDADEVSLMLVTPAGDEFYVAVVRGQGRDGLLGQRVPLRQGIAGWVAQQSEPLILNGEVRDPRFAPVLPRADIRSAISLPLLAAGKLVGVLNVNSLRQRRPFTLGQAKALSILTSTAASALQSAALYEESERLRTYNAGILETMADGLTLEDAHGQITYANARLLTLLGYTAAELIGQQWHKIVSRRERARVAEESMQNPPGQANTYESVLLAKDGREIPVLVSATRFEPGGQPAGILATFADLTERKQAEATLLLQSTALNSAANAIVITDPNGAIEWINPAVTAMTGYTAAEAIGKNPRELFKSSKQDSAYYKDLWDTVRAGEVWNGELINRRKDGSLYTEEQTITPLKNANGDITHFIAIKQDVTRRKQSEADLVATNDLLSRAEQIGHIGSWSWDIAADRTVWSDGLYRVFGQKPEQFGATYAAYMECVLPDDRDHVRQVVEDALRERQPFEYENRILRPDGDIRATYTRADVILNERGEPIRLLGIGMDITERKQADQALAASEAQLRGLFAAMTDVVLVLDADGRYLQIAPTNPSLLVKPPAELLGRTLHEALPKPDADKLLAEIQRALRQQQTIQVQYSMTIGAAPLWFDATVSPIGLDRVIWISRDVTERRQRQLEMQAIATVSTALRTAANRAQMSPIILDQLLSLFGANGSALDLYDSAIGEVGIESARGAWAALEGQQLAASEGIIGHVIASGEKYVNDDARSDPRLFPGAVTESVRAVVCVPVIVQGRVLGGLWVGREAPFGDDDLRVLTAIADMAGNAIQRATLHEQTERRLAHLAALRAIDIAISSSLDVVVTLNVVLDQVTNQLHVDAADVMLLSTSSQYLEYAAGRGFRPLAARRPRQQLGQGFAGRAALECRQISHPKLALEEPDRTQASFWAAEGFKAYYGVPLIAKGVVAGVLEIYHRAPLQPDNEWLEFLESLAGQAAIAIENAQLFGDLQRSNLELSLAYNATIEGWSRALDLRDRETEGHSQRVTELTLKLAHKLGIGAAEEIHIRRGALLHDIGKMGVPDKILLKPGPLTDDEWVIMRQHPAYAYDLLSPIQYLRQALDVPYCHHEKWDGTGYPRQLKGDAIPLSARIFAVVDVWDALCSDRPYRPAWPVDKVRDYIRDQVGKHFDPKVVEAFLTLRASE